MKKKWLLLLFFVGFLFGFLGYFGGQYYAENQRLKLVEELDTINSLEEFVSLIRFYNDTGITMEDASGFYYTRLDQDRNLEDGVLRFNSDLFYQWHVGQESELRDVLAYLSKTKRLFGITTYDESKLPTILRTHNQLHLWDADNGNTFNSIKERLEKKLRRASITEEELTTLSYIYDLEGDYEKAEKLDERNCKKKKTRCNAFVNIAIEGVVKDQNGDTVEGASIYVLNTPGKLPNKSGVDGIFNFDIKTKDLEKVRLRAIKKGFAEGYEDFYVVTGGGNQKREIEIIINQSHGTVILDTRNPRIPEIADRGKALKSVGFGNKTFEIQTTLTNYKIPQNAIVDKDGKVFKGKVKVYIYEFDKSSNIANMLRMDAKSSHEMKIFIGSILKTFGMPYVQFFVEETDQELFIEKTNPIKLLSQIAEMDALRTGSDGIYEPLTEADMKKLVADTKKLGGYPISREYLIENNLVKFPVWWIIDRKRGMWDSVPVKVLDINGKVETIFYSIDLYRK